MQKGSLVRLKNTHYVAFKAFLYQRDGDPFPFAGNIYTLSTDVEHQMCESCNIAHRVVQLEEIPGQTYPYDIFEEVQKPDEVQIVELFEAQG